MRFPGRREPFYTTVKAPPRDFNPKESWKERKARLKEERAKRLSLRAAGITGPFHKEYYDS